MGVAETLALLAGGAVAGRAGAPRSLVEQRAAPFARLAARVVLARALRPLRVVRKK